ncbi:GNAT family N-acetyltransferase [Streptomyces sp. I6]|uniref:GNAT family N-acetyltransferase n=1 Tax=Streptomyces sp. I6 TaxID=2483113 RepID=UPI000F45CF6D|nr:GNAT family N-acetyltransferase [Streptomyces sp. I6]RNL74157.1 GNAT family N-acetyltransferase [Streptomyces sp. I6]
MSPDVRPVTESEVTDWLRACRTGFLQSPEVGEELAADRLAHFDMPRVRGAFDAGRCVATYRSYTQQLTVPGGAAVPANAVSNVTVSPTHRRRGLLTSMITPDLAAAKERGEIVSTLIAAEFPIYGRYGFGPATWFTEWSIDVARTGLDPRRPGPGDGARIDLADGEEVRKLGPELYDRFRAGRAGATDRDARWWQLNTGVVPAGPEPWKEPFSALYRSAAGDVEGLAVYRAATSGWSDAGQPDTALEVEKLITVSPAAERALWHFVCSVDWVTTVRSGRRAPDDLLPLLFPDPRAARTVTCADFLWVRVLDVVRALEARTYGIPGRLVLDVHDPLGQAGGRFRLEVSPDGTAECSPTELAAELSLDLGALGSLYLGDESVLRLMALGRVSEHRAGVAALADAVFRAPRRAWCPDMF